MLSEEEETGIRVDIYMCAKQARAWKRSVYVEKLDAEEGCGLETRIVIL